MARTDWKKAFFDLYEQDKRWEQEREEQVEREHAKLRSLLCPRCQRQLDHLLETEVVEISEDEVPFYG